MRLNCDYMDLDSLIEQFQDKVPDCEKLTRNEVKQFEAIFYRLAEISNGGWISVKDKLPEHGQTVLVWEVSGFVYVDNFDDEHDVFRIAYNNCGTVTHWQSLPEPPKEDN